MTYRVTQEFQLTGDPPSQTAVDRLLEQFVHAAPQSGATLDLGLGRMLVGLTLQAEDADGAVALARTTAATVLGGRAVRVEVVPATEAGPGSPARPRAACSDPS